MWDLRARLELHMNAQNTDDLDQLLKTQSSKIALQRNGKSLGKKDLETIHIPASNPCFLLSSAPRELLSVAAKTS